MSSKISTSSQGSKSGGTGGAGTALTTVTTATHEVQDTETDSPGSSSPLTKRLAYNMDMGDKWHRPCVRFSNCVQLALLLSTLVLVIIYAFIIRRSYPIIVAVPLDFLLADDRLEVNDTDEAPTSHAEQRAEVSDGIQATVTSVKPRLLSLEDANEDRELEAGSEETTEKPLTEW